jgi:ribose transport system permease protein
MRRELGMLVAVLILGAGLWWCNDNFLGQHNIFETLRQISMFGILAIGASFVIIAGGIDLSVGSLIGLTGVVLAKISSDTGGYNQPLWIGISVAMGVALLVGLIQGLLITRLNLQPFIVTLAFMLTLRGLAQTIEGGRSITFAAFGKFANMAIVRIDDEPFIPLLFALLIVVAIASAYLLHFTVFGRYVFAIGGNRAAAEYSGIPVKKVEAITYVISAGLAGIAGVGFNSYVPEMSENVGSAYELYAIASCVLGGCSLRGGEGTIIGVIIGTGLMQIIENGLQMFQVIVKDNRGHPYFWKLSSNWKFIVIGQVILIAVVLDQLVHVIQQRRRTKAAGKAGGRTPPPASPDALPQVIAGDAVKPPSG